LASDTNNTTLAVMMHRELHVLMVDTIDTHGTFICCPSFILRLDVNDFAMSRE
jgi:hypothetical protein